MGGVIKWQERKELNICAHTVGKKKSELMRWGVPLRGNVQEKKATSRIRGGKTEKLNKYKEAGLMAKRVRFPLEMDEGIQVRGLEELREHFSLECVMGHYMSGKLIVWLKDRYLDEIVAQIEALDKEQEDFAQKLCCALGVDEQNFDTDLEEFENRNRRLTKAKEYTDDENILQNIDSIAFDQGDLYDCIDEGKKTIYLCGGRFEIPLSIKGIRYIGVNKPTAVIIAQEEVKFDELGIQFDGIEFDELYEQVVLSSVDRAIELYENKEYEEAKKIFEKCARKGVSDAMSYLGDIYRLGYGVETDLQEAFTWYLKGAEGGNSHAMNRAGLCYQYGNGTQKNDEKAFAWYLKGAEVGNPDAMNNVAIYYKNGNGTQKNDEKAFEWYSKSANAGNMYAMSNLAWCYRNGNGVQKNDEKAFELYKKSAEAGFSDAMNSVAEDYYYGNGTQKNYEKAVEWYKKGAEAGNMYAMSNLAWCYEKAMGGLSSDWKEEMKWYEKAAELGNSFAMGKTAGYYRGWPGNDDNKAMYWAQKGAEKSDERSIEILVNMYRKNGEYEKEFALLEEKAQKGDVRAMVSLWHLYSTATVMLKPYRNLQRSFYWLKQAAEKGDRNSMGELSNRYEIGSQGVPENKTEAARWRSKCDSGNTQYWDWYDC